MYIGTISAVLSLKWILIYLEAKCLEMEALALHSATAR